MLEEYRRKRDFGATPEPGPESPSGSWGALKFVVQKHAARGLHYDFRLELDGVLKSWAVPKGPSLDPAQKRLAVLVEDHPLDYGSFEGVIGAGNYGAGQVIVWDTGVYSPDEDGRLSFTDRDDAQQRMRQGVDAGKLSFTLRGHKLRGSWTLVRTSRSPKDWLLIKHQDGHASTDREVLENEQSALSGATTDDLKAGRALPAVPSAPESPVPFPDRIKPMLARLADGAFSHADWLFEPKLDGIRAMAYLRRGEVTLRSRGGNDITSEFPGVVAALEAQPREEMVLDGELVALDDAGLPNFSLFQRLRGDAGRAVGQGHGTSNAILYYVFDLLHLDGASLLSSPLSHRKQWLHRALIPDEHLRLVEYVEAEGETFFQGAASLGLEGMVAKKADSSYEPGARSRHWLKVKALQSQEFVIGGYTRGEGYRTNTFGALLLGVYEGENLRYAGRVGSGFELATIDDLLSIMRPLEIEASPFMPNLEVDKTDAVWVRPEMVAQIKFSQWTDDHRLRAPVFMGLRTDVDSKSVRRESSELVWTSALTAPQQTLSTTAEQAKIILEQLEGTPDRVLVEVAGHRIALTNLNKPLWPEANGHTAITKGDMIRYYVRISTGILPHLRDRPLTLTRYPNGIDGESFYQKHWAQGVPDYADTVGVFSSHNEGDGDYVIVNNLPTLLWLAQLADIELHPWLSRVVRTPDATNLPDTFTGSEEAIKASVLNYPDYVVFDLDPYTYSGKEKAGEEPELNRDAFSQAVGVAHALKEVLSQLSLSCYLKTSGKTGLHVYVPVLRQYDYSITRKACEVIGRYLMQQMPNDITMEWVVSRRNGKVFLDHNQNVRSKNMASIYSLRPLARGPVSTPLRWDELDRVYPTDFTIETVPPRVEALGDLWADALTVKHDLRQLLDLSQ